MVKLAASASHHGFEELNASQVRAARTWHMAEAIRKNTVLAFVVLNKVFVETEGVEFSGTLS